MALNPALRKMVAAASAKYQAEISDDEADAMRARQIGETLKDAARLAGLADPSRREEFALAAAYADGFINGSIDGAYDE
ncbi:hypothetical protein EN794_050485 [Mesorhizobium sp. M00.F.Ca.ET.151.01.1.1]|nr:hypothetical protein EN794_050485 [Mesorhizobium sp. M00.F.Ca.ET.151.01.1.1]